MIRIPLAVILTVLTFGVYNWAPSLSIAPGALAFLAWVSIKPSDEGEFFGLCLFAMLIGTIISIFYMLIPVFFN